MKTLIHISDLHFGKINNAITVPLISAFSSIKPDMVIISGDLTQRAKIKEFKGAKAFLDDIKNEGLKYLVIPGNHDIEPLFKPLKRIANPFDKYKKFISEDIEPVYFDNEVAIASINTARPSNLKGGGISVKQIKKVEMWFSLFSDSIIKIIVTHHPFDLPMLYHAKKLVPTAKKVIEQFSSQNIDLYLSGHYHRSSVITTSERFNIGENNAIAIQAGTLSVRERGEVQSFNVIKVDSSKIVIETYLCDQEAMIFKVSSIKSFEHAEGQWRILK